MTPESLVRHELAGLDVEVAESPDSDLVGIAGRVVDETTTWCFVFDSGRVSAIFTSSPTESGSSTSGVCAGIRDRRFIWRSYLGTFTSYSRSTTTVRSMSVETISPSMTCPRTDSSPWKGHVS